MYLDWIGRKWFLVYLYFLKKYIKIYVEYNDRDFRKKIEFYKLLIMNCY